MSSSVSAYRDVTVGALLTRLAAEFPNREALVYADRNLRLTFSGLEAEARLIARGLMACGGERVALWATNVPEWVVLQFAPAKIGAILVTVNTSLRACEVDYLLRQSEAATLITIRGFKGMDYVAELREIGAVTSEASDSRIPDLKRLTFIGFHCFGCVIGVLGAYTHGVCLCPVESFNARQVLETVARERCTALYGVPTIFAVARTLCPRRSKTYCAGTRSSRTWPSTQSRASSSAKRSRPPFV